MNWLQASCLLHTSHTNQLSQYWKALIMRNPDILLWFIRKKHRNQKYDLFLCCSLCHFGRSHSLLQNPLNVNLAHKHTHTSMYTDRHIMHTQKKKNMQKLWGGQVWHRVAALYVFYSPNLGRVSIWRKTKRETNYFHKRQAVTFPSERGRLRCSTFTVLPTTQQLRPNLLWSQLELLMTQ